MAREKNIDKVARILGGKIDHFDGEDCQWIELENKTHVINISFSKKGMQFDDITIAEKIYELVGEKIICKINRTEL